ncbi:hypothetical protein HYC85_021358 [Camellia sinensis]|uniref:Uncharacterized protein n=1 Tax=Camellia sinensis TaxID=4442 RepID=A0A7J7GJX8_CAMSI|nr:hypothetical protein HYC85_021358 [Camellia sinensis]
MLDTFDHEDNVWLCHECGIKTIFGFASVSPALDLFKEVKKFLISNLSEIITLILEDCVEAPKGLAKLFDAVELTQYLFPLSKMPQHGRGWPSVEHMVVNNQRLVVFTLAKSKQESEGIAYQWNFMIEYKYESEGLQIGSSTKHEGSLKLDNTDQLATASSLVDDEDLVLLVLNGIPDEYNAFKTTIKARSDPISMEALSYLLCFESIHIESSLKQSHTSEIPFTYAATRGTYRGANRGGHGGSFRGRGSSDFSRGSESCGSYSSYRSSAYSCRRRAAVELQLKPQS